MKKGFTLAEVLITLSILGIVATISIPNIIQNYQKQATVSRLKMAYSMLDRLTQQSYIENGYPPKDTTHGYNMEKNFEKYYGKYLNISKICGYDTNLGCFKNNVFKKLNNSNPYEGGYGPWAYYKVLLKNGMGLGAWSNVASSNGTIFIVDIDGPNRGSSKLGQDVFMFTYSDKCNNTGSLLIGGVPQSTCGLPSRKLVLEGCSEGGSDLGGPLPLGATCSSLIIIDGWKISSDYPWKYANKD